jgi:hypothetical protein
MWGVSNIRTYMVVSTRLIVVVSKGGGCVVIRSNCSATQVASASPFRLDVLKWYHTCVKNICCTLYLPYFPPSLELLRMKLNSKFLQQIDWLQAAYTSSEALYQFGQAGLRGCSLGAHATARPKPSRMGLNSTIVWYQSSTIPSVW